jgi:hypothetical protein
MLDLPEFLRRAPCRVYRDIEPCGRGSVRLGRLLERQKKDLLETGDEIQQAAREALRQVTAEMGFGERRKGWGSQIHYISFII